MKFNPFVIASLAVILGTAFFSGCDDEYYRRSYAEAECKSPPKKLYRCDEWDALIHCTNGDTIIVESVESPAKTKNGMICIYDRLRSFDARIQIPVEQVKYVEFVKP